MNENKTNVKREEIISKIIEYFEENESIFNDCIEELDGYNGYLGDDRYYEMDELDELLNGRPVSEILNMAFFGRDDETWTTDSRGDKQYGDFNPNRNYFYFNGYGNLVSADYKDYSDKLDTYAVEDMAKYREYIPTIEGELAELFDELEELEREAS